MTYKHKTHAVDVDGKIVSNADVDFYIDDVWLFISFSYFLFLLVWLLGNLGQESSKGVFLFLNLLSYGSKDNFELLVMEFL